MAEILPICRKILFNQSINQSINYPQYNNTDAFIWLTMADILPIRRKTPNNHSMNKTYPGQTLQLICMFYTLADSG